MIEEGARENGSRIGRLLGVWERVELPVGILLVAVGFVVIGLGWNDASQTADVRRQLQALISGGFGGLAFVLLGAILVQTQISHRSSARLEQRLDRVADAVLELAYLEGPVETAVEPSLEDVDTVLASHASYHRPGCDLARDRAGLRELSVRQARRERLRACRVCMTER